MSKRILNTIIVVAFVMISLGIAIAFIDLQELKIYIKNGEYVGAVFSLSGILLYFTALMYQITELKKSVQAQTKSSETLDKQKNILIEQNTNTLIFGMINNFNDFKERNKTQKLIDNLVNFYQSVFALRWQNNLAELRLNQKELNIKFATDIKEILTETIIKQEEFSLFKRYIQFAYNILYLIDINKKNMSRDNFTPFFFSQLNTNENIMLYLSNLVDFEMPNYSSLYWGYYTTKEIIDMIMKYDEQKVDFKEIDLNTLAEEFKNLKQNE